MAAPALQRPVVRKAAVEPARQAVSVLEGLYRQFAFYGRILAGLPRGLRYRNEILAVMGDIVFGPGALIVGAGMIFVGGSIAIFTGIEVGLEGFQGLSQIGAEAFTGIISSLANTREITPLVAGVALAAQVGAGFTAQLGAMRVSEEIDALEVMGVDSFVYLVTTRVWAALLTMIPLYLAMLFASYLATEIISTKFFYLSSGTYTHFFRLFLPSIDVLFSVVKAMVFAVVVTLIHCYYGFFASGGPAGVGVAAGRAIRASIIVVVVLNLLMSFVMFGSGTTALIVG